MRTKLYSAGGFGEGEVRIGKTKGFRLPDIGLALSSPQAEMLHLGAHF